MFPWIKIPLNLIAEGTPCLVQNQCGSDCHRLQQVIKDQFNEKQEHLNIFKNLNHNDLICNQG